jgi:ABC-type polysaccharide/polyol phosphate export permease
MIAIFSGLYEHRRLVLTLVKRDLKVRYKATTLGFLWSFGRPLFLMLIMWAVFSVIVRIKTDIPYELHLLTGILPWMFFQGAIFEAQGSILANSNVVKKVRVPGAVFPVAAVLSNLVHLFLALIILSLFIVGYTLLRDPALFPGWEVVLLPLIILLQTGLLVGIGLVLSALYVFYRDVGSLSEIFLSAWFYLTPVIYPTQMARNTLTNLTHSDWVYYLYLCNPMTPIIIAYRRVLYGRYLRHAPEVADGTLLLSLGVSATFTAGLLVFGAWLFHRMAPRFADEL